MLLGSVAAALAAPTRARPAYSESLIEGSPLNLVFEASSGSEEEAEPAPHTARSSSRALEALDMKLRRQSLSIAHDCLPHEYLLNNRSLSADKLREMRAALPVES